MEKTNYTAPVDPSSQVAVFYTDHQGNSNWCAIRPISMAFTSTKEILAKQWVLSAWDYGKATTRNFAVKGIHTWIPLKRLRLTVSQRDILYAFFNLPLGPFAAYTMCAICNITGLHREAVEAAVHSLQVQGAIEVYSNDDITNQVRLTEFFVKVGTIALEEPFCDMVNTEKTDTLGQ